MTTIEVIGSWAVQGLFLLGLLVGAVYVLVAGIDHFVEKDKGDKI